jgi:hypothetical protein
LDWFARQMRGQWFIVPYARRDTMDSVSSSTMVYCLPGMGLAINRQFLVYVNFDDAMLLYVNASSAYKPPVAKFDCPRK